MAPRKLETIHARLWHLRNRELGMTQKDFRKRVNAQLEKPVSHGAVANYEAKGRAASERSRVAEPRASYLAAIKKAFPYVRLEWLILGRGEPTELKEAMRLEIEEPERLIGFLAETDSGVDQLTRHKMSSFSKIDNVLDEYELPAVVRMALLGMIFEGYTAEFVAKMEELRESWVTDDGDIEIDLAELPEFDEEVARSFVEGIILRALGSDEMNPRETTAALLCQLAITHLRIGGSREVGPSREVS